MAQNEGWQPKFEEVQAGVEYYLYNVGTKTYLNDGNTLSAIPSTTWTVDGNAVKSQNGNYISVTSRNTGSTLRPNWVVTGTAAADAAGLGNVANNGSYYSFYSNVQYRSVLIGGNNQNRYFQAAESGVNAEATSATANAQWIFVSKSIYDATFSAAEESLNFGNVVVNTQTTMTITLTHSPRLGDVTVSSDNSIFTVSTVTIEGGEGAPTTAEITVTYNAPARAASHNSNITISAGEKSIVIPVSGVTKAALSLNNLKTAITYAEGIIATAEAKLGFAKGEYAPYEGKEYRELLAKAYDMVEHQANYTQNEVNSVVSDLGKTSLTNWSNKEWKSNSKEVNAVAPNTVITDVYGNDAPNYLMPLKGNQLYSLSFNYTGKANVIVKDANGVEVANFNAPNVSESTPYSYVFITSEAGNYTINVTGAELTNVEVFTTEDASSAFTPVALEDGAKFYLMNKATGYFIGADNTMYGCNAVLYTAVQAGEGKYALVNEEGKYINITINVDDGTLGTGGSGTPTSVVVVPNGEETIFTVSEANGGYLFSVEKTWKYGGAIGIGRQDAAYTAYLSANAGDGNATLSEKDQKGDTYNVWVLVSEDEYAASKTVAIARLRKAVADATTTLESDGPLLGAKANVATLRTEGQAILIATGIYTTSIINGVAQNIEEAIAAYMEMSDYYTACKDELDVMKEMGTGNLSNISIEAATSKEQMASIMTTAHLASFAYLMKDGLGLTFDDNTNFTGLISNHSFDRGDMSGWYTLKFNTSEAASSIGSIISGAISGGASGALGGLAGIADAISLDDFDANSISKENVGSMTNGHKKYYYETRNSGLLGNLTPTGQVIFQPLLGLPAGTYRASALMSGNFGTFLGIGNNTCHLSAIVIPTSILGDAISGIGISDIINGETSKILSSILSNLGPALSKGSIVSADGSASSSTEFTEVNLDFEVEDGAIVILTLNAGLIPLVGTSPFRADNVRLTYLQSPKSAKNQLTNAINNADVPQANIANKASDERPFTYNTTLVNQYQSALDKANEVANSGSNKTSELAAAAKELADIEATFFEKAFQGPSANGIYNLTMKEEGLGISEKAVTFTSTDNGYNMKFTDAAGSTNYHQVVAFEKVDGAVNTYVVSIKDKDNNKVYLSGTTTLSTTPDKESATIFSVVPSTSVETVAAISNGNNTLGTSSNNIVLAGVSGRNAHTSLSVTPAAKHEVTLNISPVVGWGTFMLPYDAEIPSGVKAYKATGVENNAVVLEEVNEFEACVPYIVSAEGGKKETLSGIALATQNFYTEGILKGANELSPVAENQGNYLLQNNNNKLGFYYVADKGLQIGANRAFLMYDGAQSVKMFSLDADATGIDAIDSEAGKDVIYDLSGRRVNNAVKGVYIINGKKVIK